MFAPKQFRWFRRPQPTLRYIALMAHTPAKLIIRLAEISDAKAIATLSAKVYGKAHAFRSEEHTSELQSLMRISYAVFCLKKKNNKKKKRQHKQQNIRIM